jgi:hypothetical protein
MSQANGIIDKLSHHSVEETVERLKRILQSKGVTLFAIIDHSGEAKKVGMKMRPTKLLIFGSPKAGTPLMLAAPSVAIDLPLKILVSDWDSSGALNPGQIQRCTRSSMPLPLRIFTGPRSETRTISPSGLVRPA